MVFPIWYKSIDVKLLRAIPFSKAHWGGTWTFLEGTYHHNYIMLTPHFLRILNSILHLEPPFATPSSHILNYLIPPTPHYE